jgi:pilus assembly protein FimV
LNTRSILTARTALAVAAAAALGTATIDAQALGLGRLSVQSALGESLKAEIDISSMSAEESSTLSVRVASPEAYRAAGVDYNAVLSNAQVTLLRRPDGRPYLRVTSDRAVQEPFVDVILELNWSTGRLVREFTLLVDPPSRAAPAAQAVAPAPIAPAMAPAPTPAPAPAPAAAPAPTAAAPTTPAATPRPTAAPARPTVANAEGDRYQVRPGDSLSRIANRTQRPGVQLDQMLVGLFRANPDAFMSSNMNRLRAGVVLAVPGADALKAIAPAEAREVIAAHSADFGAYRQKLAQGAPAAVTGEPARQSQGKVQAAVQDRKQTAPAADKLKLSAAPKASAPEAQVAKAAEKKDSATRVAELTRNVEDLKKLQQGATAAQPGTKSTPGASAPGVAVAVPPPVQASAPAPAPSVAAVTAKPVAASAPAPATTKAAATVPSAPVVAAAASPALQPEVKASAAVAASAPRPRPVAAAKPAEEPGLLDSLLSSPLALPGAGLLAIVLAGLGYYKFRGRGGRKEGGETSFLESRVQPDSFFGASGGQRIDTTDQSAGTSSMGFSLSQLDAIGDVDPVAEADVYLAYGRDLQAEEILKEAMRTTPDRLAIRTKLLEVYAKRRDTKGFELLATQLFAITQGIGADWEKAQEMGRQIDPENALYQPGGRPAEVVRDGQVIAEPLNATTLPQSVMPTASMFPNNEPTLPQPSSLDLDLDLDIDSGAPAPDETTRTMPAAKPGAAAAPTAPPAPAPDLDLGDLSLDLDVPPTIPVPKAAKASDASLDFGDFRLSEPGALSGGSGSVAMGADELPIDESDPIARKIELAEEFRQIGDMEGARDLLEEVIAKSSGALKAKAQHMLGELG